MQTDQESERNKIHKRTNSQQLSSSQRLMRINEVAESSHVDNNSNWDRRESQYESKASMSQKRIS